MFSRLSLRSITRVASIHITPQLRTTPLQRTILPLRRTYATNASDIAAHPKVQELFDQMQKHPRILQSLQDIREAIKHKTQQSIATHGELNEAKLIEIFKDPEVVQLFNAFFNEMGKAGLQITDPKQLDFLHAYIGAQAS